MNILSVCMCVDMYTIVTKNKDITGKKVRSTDQIQN